MSRIICFLFLLMLVCGPLAAQQSVRLTGKDSTSTKSNSDTGALKKTLSGKADPYLKGLQSKKDVITSNGASQQLKQGRNQISQVDSQLTKGLKSIRPEKIKINLSLGNTVQYNPLPAGIISINPNQKFADKVSVQGNILAWGVPLNFNFTNDNNSLTGLNDVHNSLFKFDFNPAQYNTVLKSDLQKYYDVRKNAFAGLDLTSYTQGVLKQQLQSQRSNASNKANNSAISQYIDQPENVTGLLSLNELQIKQKLHAVADAESKKETGSAAGGLKDAAGNQDLSTNTINAQNKALSAFSSNPNVKQYFNDPQKVKELQYMNEEQITQKLSSLSPENTVDYSKELAGMDMIQPVRGFKLSTFVSNEMAQRARSKDDVIKKMSRQLFLSRASGNPVRLNDVVSKASQQVNQNSPSQINSQVRSLKSLNTNKPIEALGNNNINNTNKQIDSVAHAITEIKNRLKSKGIDVNKMLTIQKSMGNSGDVPNTEAVKGFLANRPQNAMQTLFSRVQSFKLGSFGNSVPGSTQNDDLFMEGTHLTYKAGNIPITLGYGNLNDIASAKDAGYQASDYSSAKSITYLGLKVNNGVFGNAKFSVIGSGGNYGNNYNNYTVPVSPSSNVAVTISKFFNTGDIGKFTFDVSKSTTLFYKDLTPGSSDILDKKAGLDYSGSNLMDALSFGVEHQLDIKEQGVSETAYFNYSGTGYQNPGNVGLGGGGMKAGGNLKKLLFKNKLTLSLRTDIDDKSISYTTDDKWKTYQVQLDSRYTINKKFNISLKYLNGGTDKQVDNIVTPVYTSQKYQFDGNATYKIGKNYTVSHITIGKQDYNNTYITTTGSSLLMVNYTQSLMLKRNSLTATVFYNKELTDYNLIGNLLNSDLTYQYIIFGKVNMASALTYLSNAGIANQAGIRQSIQLLAGSHFDLDTYVDVRRNLITPLYPDLYATCRAELSLKYYIKN